MTSAVAWRMFREWFDVRIHIMVEDVVDAPYELD
jgi:hypothetical protein